MYFRCLIKISKKCSECNEKMVELKDKTPEGIEYIYFKCENCGEESLNMKQLHNVAEEYRRIKKYNAKLTKWGQSLGLTKELAKNTNLRMMKKLQ